MNAFRIAARSLTCLAVLMVACIAASADTNYVWTNGLHIAPFETWENAATNIQVAINAAVGPTNVVLVTNGWYAIGSEITLNKGVRVQSVNGRNNTVVYRTGPANHRIFSVSHIDAVLDGVTISNGNATTVGGGGVLINTGTVQNCLLTRNTASTYGGGVLFLKTGTVVNCMFIRNSAATTGSGVALDNDTQTGDGTLQNCILSGHTGNALYMRGKGTVRGCVIYASWQDQSSSAYYHYPVNPAIQHQFENCTISRNSCGYGGVMYPFFWRATPMVFTNNLIFGNTSYHPDPQSPNLFGRSMYLENSLIPHYTWGVGVRNLTTHDPQFVDPNTYDFRLRPGSPCINAGTNLPWMVGVTDLAGNPRIADGSVDIGAYEYTPGPLDCNLICTNGAEIFSSQTASFTAHAAGTNLSGLHYQWDYTTDGSYDLEGGAATTASTTFTAGTYNVTLRVTNSAGEVALCTRTNYLKVGPQNAYVSLTGGHVPPFDSLANASTSIQAAVDLGVDGTTVWVTNGVYQITNAITLRQNAVAVRSINGYEATTIQGPWVNGITCFDISHPGAVVDGFTITRGYRTSGGNSPGGGITSEVMFEGKVPRYNRARIENCLITGNYGYVGGVHGYASTHLRNCLVTRNEGQNSGGGYLREWGVIENCIFSSNTNTYNNNEWGASGVWMGMHTGLGWIYNTIVYGNTNTYSLAVNAVLRGQPYVYYSMFPTGANAGLRADCYGNITNVNPMLTDPAAANYRPRPASPAVDAGTNVTFAGSTWISAIGARDLDRNPRLVRARVDIGCFEAGPRGAVLFIR